MKLERYWSEDDNATTHMRSTRAADAAPIVVGHLDMYCTTASCLVVYRSRSTPAVAFDGMRAAHRTAYTMCITAVPR
eukprot:7641226-Pyramimonas_sp.AAC.1